MTLDEWLSLARHLKTMYPNEKFLPTKDIVEVWYAYLKDLETVYVKIAVREWVKDSTFYPQVSDIRTKAEEAKEEAKSKLKELKDIYENCHSRFPINLQEPDDWNSFKAAISSERFEDAKSKALKIKTRVMTDYKLTRPFKEYVNEIN